MNTDRELLKAFELNATASLLALCHRKPKLLESIIQNQVQLCMSMPMDVRDKILGQALSFNDSIVVLWAAAAAYSSQRLTAERRLSELAKGDSVFARLAREFILLASDDGSSFQNAIEGSFERVLGHLSKEHDLSGQNRVLRSSNSDVSKFIELHSKCSIRLLPIGNEHAAFSKFGGAPDGLISGDWPTNPSGAPLDFIAQLRLSELPRVEESRLLPKEGTLYFFFDMESEPWGDSLESLGYWRVLYKAEESGRTAMDGPKKTDSLKERLMSFSVEKTIPFHISDLVESWDRTWQDQADYFRVQEELQRLYCRGEDTPVHRTLGFPELIQRDIFGQASRILSSHVSQGAQADISSSVNWILLLQVDSDSELGTYWGTWGKLYFIIREDDALAMAFDKVWCIVQCA